MRKEVIILVFILLLAAFFRFWQLDQIPPGLYPDVAINGNNALDALKTHNFQVFYPDNNGREGLFINLIALSFASFGVSVWSIKVVAAVFGWLTVLGLYLLVREMFRKESVALLSAFFLAIGFWHVNFSRLGFRAILVPFFLVFALYFLFKGLNRLREKKKICWLCPLLAGFFFGLGFHTYISFRVAPLILAAIFPPFYLIFRRENLRKKFLVYGFWFLAAAGLAALPIGLYFLAHPADFLGRAAGVSIFQAASPARALLTSLVAHLAMFNFVGDFNWRHNLTGQPLLFWPVGLLFLLGLIYSLKQAISSLKDKNSSLFLASYSPLIFWFVMLLPGILTIEGVPHALRSIGAIPGAFILAGLGGGFLLERIWSFAQKQSRGNFLILLGGLGLFFLSLTLAEYGRYFELWGKSPEVQAAFSSDLAQVGRFLNSLPAGTDKYVLVNLDGVLVRGLPMPAQTPIFIERTRFGQPRAVYLRMEELTAIKPGEGTVVIPLKPDEEIFERLRASFPQGRPGSQGGVWWYEI